MKSFEQLKIEYDRNHYTDISLECFLPVHLTHKKIESNLKNKDGSNNEQYYKWQFLNCFV